MHKHIRMTVSLLSRKIIDITYTTNGSSKILAFVAEHAANLVHVILNRGIVHLEESEISHIQRVSGKKRNARYAPFRCGSECSIAYFHKEYTRQHLHYCT